MSRQKLLRWYERRARDLPWRRRPVDPYRVLVSEFMLQQTRVETALPYYERFVQRFPDLETLAGADQEDVLVHWAGLGYYKRARQLHQAAKAIHAAGSFPQAVEGLRALPGIGPYTAAAIASIAFGVAVPVLDGNVLRVESRRAGIRDPWNASARRRLETRLQDLVDPCRAGDSNQALMELGATVCTPTNPDCPRCPLRGDCRGAASGTPERFPRPRPRRRSERLDLVAVWLEDRRGRVRVFRRPSTATLLAGSWELPWVERPAAPVHAAGLLAARYGGAWRLGETLGVARHAITHRLLRVELVRGALVGAPEVLPGIEARWVTPGEVATLPRSSLVDKLVRCAGRAADGARR